MDLVRAETSLEDLTRMELVRLGERVEMLGARDMVRAAGAGPSGAPLLRAEEVDGGLAVASESIAHPYFNRAFGLGLHGPVRLDLLDQLDRLYRPFATVALAQIPDDADTAVVQERAAALGWQRAPGWVKMVRGPEAPSEVRTDLRIEPIGPEQAAAAGAIIVEAFHTPQLTAALAGGLLKDHGWQVYGAFEGDTLAAIGALASYGEIGYLAVGATLESFRNRGAQSAIMARRLRDGAAQGVRIFVTETGMETHEQPNPSYRNMVRLGFRLAYHRADYVIG